MVAMRVRSKFHLFSHAQVSQVKRNTLIDCTNTCQYVWVVIPLRILSIGNVLFETCYPQLPSLIMPKSQTFWMFLLSLSYTASSSSSRYFCLLLFFLWVLVINALAFLWFGWMLWILCVSDTTGRKHWWLFLPILWILPSGSVAILR